MATVGRILETYTQSGRLISYTGCSPRDIAPYLAESVATNGKEFVRGFSSHVSLVPLRFFVPRHETILLVSRR